MAEAAAARGIWSSPQVLTYQSEASKDASVAGTKLRWSPITIPRDAGPQVVDTPNDPRHKTPELLDEASALPT